MKKTILLFDDDYQPECYENDENKETEINESTNSVQSKPQFSEIMSVVDDLPF
jgi:hypothetical protein